MIIIRLLLLMESTLKQQIVSTLFATSLRNFGRLFIKLLMLIFKLKVGITKTSYDHHKITTTNGEYFEATDCFHSIRNKSQKFWPVIIKLLTLIFKLQGGH